MHRYLLFLLAFLLFSAILSAQENHMDIMTTMTGEHNYSSMGRVMTTLDWNGDAYDDLIVNSPNWDPRGYTPNYPPFPYGKLYVYFGGPNFDNDPEMEIPGTHEIEFGHTTSMCNAGDMNGDSIDELALFRAMMYENNNNQNYDLQLCVYYGGANPDTIPDYVLTFPREVWKNGGGFVRSLGDVNHDGFDDLGYVMIKDYNQAPNTFGIIYGGSMENTVFIETGTSWESTNFYGIGDINRDGFDDFSIGYKYIIDDNNERYSKIVLYYGNSSGVYSDSTVICEGLSFNAFVSPAGDVNGDGNADFVSSFTGTNAKLYFGGQEFNGTQFVTFAPPYYGGNWQQGFGHGDVNGDGRDDLIGTFVTQATGNGVACLWMSDAPVNGDPDLYIPPPLPPFVDSQMFGFCLTMGDYNGDGFCDAAISAPFDYSGTGIPGRVFVYAGNPLLVDPIDDETAPVITKTLQLYPNPLQPQQSNLNVKFNKQPSNQSSIFDIYNIKGQKIKSFTISAEQAKSGSATYHLNDLSSGVYVCVLSNGKMQNKVKITIIK